MILGVDHIAVSCEHLDEAVLAYAQLGYTKRFEIRHLPNPSEKKEYVQRYAATHSIALMDHPNRISVELTCHGERLGTGKSPYQIGESWIEIRTPLIEASKVFWKALLPSAQASVDGLTFRLTFRGLLDKGKTFELRFVPSEPCLGYLDSPGGTCLALVTHRLEDELKKMAPLFLSVTAPFLLTIKDKVLKIALARGPSGEMIELIQFMNAQGMGYPRAQR